MCVRACVRACGAKLQHAPTCGCSRYASWSCALFACGAWPCRLSRVSQHLLLCHTLCTAPTLVQHPTSCARMQSVIISTLTVVQSASSCVNSVSFLGSKVHQDTLIACPSGYGAVRALAEALPNLPLILIVSASVNPCVSACDSASLHLSVGVSRPASGRHCMSQCMCPRMCQIQHMLHDYI